MDDAERQRIIAALDIWIKVKIEQQSLSEAAGRSQQGGRAAVTGGKHLAGVNQLILNQLNQLGLKRISTYADRAATVPGYFRASKSWDLLVLEHQDPLTPPRPLLVVEYKSMTGSEGKNLNNRADEVIGVAQDLRYAQEAGLIEQGLCRAYVFLMEVSPEVQQPVGVKVRAGNPDAVFDGATYLQRMAIMCERLRDAGLYDLAWAVGVVREPRTDFIEPLESVGWDRFSVELRTTMSR